LPEELGKIVLKNTNKFSVSLMFQGEARFGRMSDPGKCWVTVPHRPKIMKDLVREYRYIFGAVCPKIGHTDYMESFDMNTNSMSRFLRQVSKAHPNKLVVMVVDEVSPHKSNGLVIPSNVLTRRIIMIDQILLIIYR
jgi:hypothetical protein